MTDPIADFLTRIRNAVSVGHKVVEIPGSKIKLEMTKILKEKGYILNYKFEQEGARSNIKIALKYHPLLFQDSQLVLNFHITDFELGQYRKQIVPVV
jgi:ribosomal protein S8